MYSLTNEEDDYYCHILCGCGRKYRAEEMYICYNCNKVMCRFCISSEYEYSGCKNSCSRNRIISKQSSNDKKNKCDVCLECPKCFSALIKRNLNGNFMYVCSYCYYDTTNIRLSRTKEVELDLTVGKIQESSSGGYLKKMYVNVCKKLKDNMFSDNKMKIPVSKNNYSTTTEFKQIVNKAMEQGPWSIEKLEKDIKNEIYEIEEKEQLPIKYDDSYIKNANLYTAFTLIMQYTGASIDYSDNDINNIDELKEKLMYDLNPRSISNLEQRYNHVIFQHPYVEMQFPNFFDLIPNKSEVVKKCKQCRKIIIQAAAADYVGDNRIKTIKFDIGHMFIKQFPVESIYKIDLENKVLMIKFLLYEFKEVTLHFKEDETSEVKCIIPEDSYIIGTAIPEDDFIFKSTEKSIIVNFKFKDDYINKLIKDSYHIFKLLIEAEYDRGGVETKSKLHYGTEIKFKIN